LFDETGSTRFGFGQGDLDRVGHQRGSCALDRRPANATSLASLDAVSRDVLILGTGLIGTSLGIALSRKGYRIQLSDPSPTAERLARDLGAGELLGDGAPAPDLVVVAAPPDVAADVVARALDRFSEAVVTDVASVKAVILDALTARGADVTRYVGSHPMAGRERTGAGAARGDLFEGRAWVIVPTPSSTSVAIERVKELGYAAGSAVSVMDARGHDAAVAAVSHLPQVVASLVAGQLRTLDEGALALSGQGVRDVTRIAASDPRLWTQILAGNAGAVREVLLRVQADLAELLTALDDLHSGEGVGSLEVVNRTIVHGNAGRARIPGKHGAAPTAYETVTVVVPDEPGALARLFKDIGDAGVNLEDMRLDHGIGQPFGLADILVVPSAVERLHEVLERSGWRVHD
jgi:prephenate dehydrogenase